MGKKRKRRSGAYGSKPVLARRSRSRNYLFLLVIVVILGAGGIYLLMEAKEKTRTTAAGSRSMAGMVKASGEPYNFRETRTTLSPVLFVGDVAKAYRTARQIPEVLDQIYCYCRCAENFGHKSLLSCYVDRHAAT